MERGSGHGTFWIISFVVSVLLAAIFQWLNKSEELKRVTHASSYRGAYLSVGTLYTEVMDAIDDKDTKRFISTERTATMRAGMSGDGELMQAEKVMNLRMRTARRLLP